MLERHLRSVWSRAPLTLRAYFLVSVVLSAVCLALYPSLSEFIWLTGGAMLAYFVLRGVRWVWIAVVATSIVFLAIELRAGVSWIGNGLSVFGLALLLAPQTRRYFRRETPESVKEPRLRDIWAVRAAASTGGLLAILLICHAIGGAARYVGLVAFLGMALSAAFALILSVVGLLSLAREPQRSAEP